MKTNMGTTDRVVRILTAVLIAILYFAGIINGTVAVVLVILAAVFIATSFIGFCPLYLPFGVSTKRKTSKA